LGFASGPVVVVAVYGFLRPINTSGGLAAFITILSAAVGILTAIVFGPLAALASPATAVGLAAAARIFELPGEERRCP